MTTDNSDSRGRWRRALAVVAILVIGLLLMAGWVWRTALVEPTRWPAISLWLSDDPRVVVPAMVAQQGIDPDVHYSVPIPAPGAAHELQHPLISLVAAPVPMPRITAYLDRIADDDPAVLRARLARAIALDGPGPAIRARMHDGVTQIQVFDDGRVRSLPRLIYRPAKGGIVPRLRRPAGRYVAEAILAQSLSHPRAAAWWRELAHDPTHFSTLSPVERAQREWAWCWVLTAGDAADYQAMLHAQDAALSPQSSDGTPPGWWDVGLAQRLIWCWGPYHAPDQHPDAALMRARLVLLRTRLRQSPSLLIDADRPLGVVVDDWARLGVDVGPWPPADGAPAQP